MKFFYRPLWITKSVTVSESVIGERAFAQTKAVVTELTKRYCVRSVTKWKLQYRLQEVILKTASKEAKEEREG